MAFGGMDAPDTTIRHHRICSWLIQWRQNYGTSVRADIVCELRRPLVSAARTNHRRLSVWLFWSAVLKTCLSWRECGWS